MIDSARSSANSLEQQHENYVHGRGDTKDCGLRTEDCGRTKSAMRTYTMARVSQDAAGRSVSVARAHTHAANAAVCIFLGWFLRSAVFASFRSDFRSPVLFCCRAVPLLVWFGTRVDCSSIKTVRA